MRKIVALALVALTLGGCSTGLIQLPVSAPAAAPSGGPHNAPPNECYTDEGYGRWHPCGNMG